MAQILATDFPIDPTTTSGTALSQILNRFEQAAFSTQAGATEPPTTFAGMLWVDMSAGGNGVLKIRNAPNSAWHTLINTGGTPLPSSGGTFTGTIAIAASDAVLVLNKTGAPGAAAILAQHNGVGRWDMFFGNATPEGGANAGSDFVLNRYSDTGALLGSPIICTRSTGRVLIPLLHIGQASQFGFYEDPTYSYSQYNPAWTWRFNKGDGELYWIRPTGKHTRFFSDGALSTAGDFTCGSSLLMTLAENSVNRWLGFASSWLLTFNIGNGQLQWEMPGQVHSTWNTANGYVLWVGNASKPGGGTWADASDERVKDNIADYTAGLAQVLALRPRSYTFKEGMSVDPTKTHYGLIAQEAQPVMPELVGGVMLAAESIPDDPDEVRQRNPYALMRPLLGADQYEGEDVELLTLDATALTFALVNAVRELNTKVDEYIAAHP